MWGAGLRGYQAVARKIGVKVDAPEVRLPDLVGYENRP